MVITTAHTKVGFTFWNLESSYYSLIQKYDTESCTFDSICQHCFHQNETGTYRIFANNTIKFINERSKLSSYKVSLPHTHCQDMLYFVCGNNRLSVERQTNGIDIFFSTQCWYLDRCFCNFFCHSLSVTVVLCELLLNTFK